MRKRANNAAQLLFKPGHVKFPTVIKFYLASDIPRYCKCLQGKCIYIDVRKTQLTFISSFIPASFFSIAIFSLFSVSEPEFLADS